MSEWSGGVCRTDEAEIFYRRSGGARPPIVLLHGLTGSGACWTPVARCLEERYDVIMPDARGHGDSSAPLHGYGYHDHARDAVALVRQLELEAPVLLGHSMGGMTAAVAAAMLCGSIGALILADPTFISPQWQRDVRDSDVAEQHRRTLAMDHAAVAAEIRSRHPHRSPELVEILARARLQTRMSAFDVLTPPSPAHRELLREISVPVLLVIAERGVVSLEAARELQTLNPRVELHRVEDAGHGVPYDQPERLAAAVTAFLLSSQTPPACTSRHSSLPKNMP